MSLTITLRNISNLADVSDYHYEVYVNTKCIEHGYVRGHHRADGWESLMALLATEREVKEAYPQAKAPSRPAKQHPPVRLQDGKSPEWTCPRCGGDALWCGCK